MVTMSQKYADAMSQLFRNRGYIEVDMGIDVVSAHLMETWMTGSPLTESSDWGMVLSGTATASNELVFEKTMNEIRSSGETASIEIWFRNPTYIRSIRLDFDGSHPTHVTAEAVHKRPDGEDIWMNEMFNDPEDESSIASYTFDNIGSNIDYIRLTIESLHDNNTQPKIRNISFDGRLYYTNDDVVSASLSESMSIINESLPQRDFSVTVYNYNDSWNWENPNGITNGIKAGMPIRARFGMDVSTTDEPEIEWCDWYTLVFSDYSFEGETVVITATDALRNMTGNFEKSEMLNDGSYAIPNMRYVINSIFTEAGVYDFRVANEFGGITQALPIPVMPCNELLQKIANAYGAYIKLERDGTIVLDFQKNIGGQYPVSGSTDLMYLSSDDIMGRPVLNRLDNMKTITVSLNSITGTTETEEISSAEITTTQANEWVKLTWDETPLAKMSVVMDETTTLVMRNVTNYSCEVRVPTVGTHEIVLSGNRYSVGAVPYTVEIPDSTGGEDLQWDNPLATPDYRDQHVAEMLDYYSSRYDFELEYRGNPQIDMGDTVIQYGTYGDRNVVITSNKLEFNGVFSGTLVTHSLRGD